LPAAAFVISPLLDMTYTDSRVYDNLPSDPIFGPTGAGVAVACMLRAADPEMDLTDPFVSPLLASMEGIPPLLVQCTTVEVVYSDSQRLVEKAQADGVDATLQTWDGLFHDFEVGALNHLPQAREANEKIAEFITARIG
jgi:acetyl esterase/lipase